MSASTLFKPKRTCCVCGSEATGNLRGRIEGEPNVIAITPVIYLRGNGKGQLRNAPRVQVCEPCLIRALVGGRFGIGNQAAKIWAALRESLSYRYGAMKEDDAMQPDSPEWDSIGKSVRGLFQNEEEA
jgi:hypothetical protein